MMGVKMSLEELKALVERIENQVQYHNMKPYVFVSISQHPNDRKFVEFEQPCQYAECNSTYYRYEERKE